MDLPLNPLDGMDHTGPIRLPANVTTVLAEDLRARIVLSADQDAAIILDATDTESLGQAALQLLVAAGREAERLEIPFAIQNIRSTLFDRLETLGLAETLGLHSQTDFTQEELPQ